MPEPPARAHPPVRVVCFDWGGVLLRICRSFADGATRAGLDVRIDADDPEPYSVRRSIAARYQLGELDDDAFFEHMSRSTGGAYSPGEVARIHDAWLIEEYPGVAALVEELHALGSVATALLSNTNARHWARREVDFRVGGSLRHQHASHLLRLVKPDPRIYGTLEREVGAAGPEIMFFDDLRDNVEAARAAGWRVVLVDHEGDTAAQMRGALVEVGVLAPR